MLVVWVVISCKLVVVISPHSIGDFDWFCLLVNEAKSSWRLSNFCSAWHLCSWGIEACCAIADGRWLVSVHENSWLLSIPPHKPPKLPMVFGEISWCSEIPAVMPFPVQHLSRPPSRLHHSLPFACSPPVCPYLEFLRFLGEDLSLPQAPEVGG